MRLFSHLTTPLLLSNVMAFAGAVAYASAAQTSNKAALSLSSLNSLKRIKVVVVDPNESTPDKPASIAFQALDGRQVMDVLFKGRQNWVGKKQAVFSCADGYQPSLPISVLAKGRFYFAFARVGSKKFQLVNQLKNAKVESLAPFYIVWTTPSLQRPERSHFWPYQVVGVSLK